MKRFTILFLFFCSISLHSQTIDLGQPNGWNGRIITKKNIPVKVMSRFNQSLINSEDVINDALKDRPWRFGYKYCLCSCLIVLLALAHFCTSI